MNDQNVAYTEGEAYTQRLPLLRSGRDPAPPFDPAKLALTDRVPRSTATLRLTSTSAASAAAAPKGSKHYSGPGSYGAPALN